MKAICPNNREHDRFTTTVHVMQEWEVDSKGEYLDVVDDFMQISSPPDIQNIWICSECGEQAIFEN